MFDAWKFTISIVVTVVSAFPLSSVATTVVTVLSGTPPFGIFALAAIS